MNMKYFLSIMLLLSSCLFWPFHMPASARETVEAAVPAKTKGYASVDRTASAANIRSEASLSSEVLLAAPPGYPLAVLELMGNWVLVEDFLQRRGWVFASLLTGHETAIVKVWKGNLRTGPGLTEGVITKLDHGALVSVTGTSGDWLQVSDSDGVSGWLHRDVVWPPKMTASAWDLAVTGVMPAQSVKEIKTRELKRKVAGADMPATTEQAPGPIAAQEHPPEPISPEDHTSVTRIEARSGAGPKESRPSGIPPVVSLGKGHVFRGNISVEGRLFGSEPLYPDQERNNGSVAIAPEYYYVWPGGSSFIFAPFVRIDSADSERTHFDIRELNFLLVGDPWELRLGIGKVFWGVTEFVHLVDIINQTDLVENIRGEDKLGQPMAQLSVPTDWGMVDVFILPYFRERTFPGPDGRLRSEPVVDTDNPVFESGAEENHVDFALRYSQVFDFFDFGVYYFRGTGRDPLFLPAVNPGGRSVLLPYYRQIDQVGTDLQLVAGNWLWKLEALYQDNEEDPYFAATGGLEYTFFGIGGSLLDLGLIAEYAYDDRGDYATTPFENDLFGGLRLAVNDAAGTELLFGLSYDLDDKSNVLQLEASRRLGDSFKIFLEGWAFFNTEPGDYYIYSIRDDDFLRLQIFYYF